MACFLQFSQPVPCKQFPSPTTRGFLQSSVIAPLLFTNSPKILRVIKSRRMRLAGHVARMGEGRDVYSVWVGKTERKRPLGRPGVDERIILRWIFKKWDVGVWTGSGWLSVWTGGAGTCECGNEPSGSIKCGNFLTSCKPVSFSRRTLLHGVSE